MLGPTCRKGPAHGPSPGDTRRSKPFLTPYGITLFLLRAKDSLRETIPIYSELTTLHPTDLLPAKGRTGL